VPSHNVLLTHNEVEAVTAGVVRFLSDDLLDSLAGYDSIEDLRASLPPALLSPSL
jgi:hypothetical protein